MDWSVKVTDLAIIFATIIGPIAAVQAQKWLERGRETRARQTLIFRTLMGTRGALLAPDHVRAINSIPLDFYPTSPKLKAINTAWKTYIDHLGVKQVPGDQWAERRVDYLLELLQLIGAYVGYEFTVVEMKREFYAPVGHATVESEQDLIRQGFAKLFKGEASLPLAVREMPVDAEFRALLVKWLTKAAA
jgi:hypothetical protein